MGDIIIIGLLVIVGIWALFSCLRKRGCTSCSGTSPCANCSRTCCGRSVTRCLNSSQPGGTSDSKPPNV